MGELVGGVSWGMGEVHAEVVRDWISVRAASTYSMMDENTCDQPSSPSINISPLIQHLHKVL